MLDNFLDIVLGCVVIAVVAAIAIPVFALTIELFYAVPIFIFIAILAVASVLAAWAYRRLMPRWQVRGDQKTKIDTL